MIKLANESIAKRRYKQQLLNNIYQGKGLEKVKSDKETEANNQRDTFQSGNIEGRNWNKKPAFYNAQGRKTNRVFNLAKTTKKAGVELNLPVKSATISSDYGEDRGGHIHKGIDFDGNMGDDILSAANGKVVFVGEIEDGGNTVAIQHAGGIVSKYMHLQEQGVKEGQFIKAGEKIGTMGNTGNTYSVNNGDGSHLHFEVMEDGQNVDPDKYLNLRGVEHKVGDYGGAEILRDFTLDKDLVPIGKEEHYSRNKLNKAPATLGELKGEKDNWIKMDEDKSLYHMQGEDGLDNVKYVSIDGHYEAVYGSGDDDAILLTEENDPVNMGTYNFKDPNNDPVGHFLYDMLPYYLWGNSPEDCTDVYDRVVGINLHGPGYKSC